MIGRRSRYTRTKTTSLTDASGEVLTLIEPRDIERIVSVFAHTVVEGDRLDLLAQRYYRNPLLSYRIADASDELDPFRVAIAGRQIPIPPAR